MKKIVILFVFLIALGLKSDAQDLDVDRFRFGFQVSPGVSWMGTNDNKINAAGANFSFAMGMSGEYYFAENYAFSFGLGLAFGQGGTLQSELGGNFFPNSELSDSSYYDLPSGVQSKYKIQYVQIPFGLKMRTKEIGYMRYFAEVPVFTLGIPTQSRGDILGEGLTATTNENIAPEIFPVSLSWGFGGGVEYSITEQTSIVGGVFFQSSIIDIIKNNGTLSDGKSEDSKATLSGVTFRVGVFF